VKNHFDALIRGLIEHGPVKEAVAARRLLFLWPKPLVAMPEVNICLM